MIDILQKDVLSTLDQDVIESICSLPGDSFYCTFSGHVIPDVVQFIKANELQDVKFRIHLRIRGGKGGFGSMLRSFRLNKSTNQLMCRDLNGRRLASVEEERKLRKWIEKAAQREKEKTEKKKLKYERLKSGGPKHEFNDPEYFKQREDILESTEDAFEEGFENFKKSRESAKKKISTTNDDASSESDCDLEAFANGRAGVKRRRIDSSSSIPEKAAKTAQEESDSDSEDEVDPALISELQTYFSEHPEQSTSSGSAETNTDSTSGTSEAPNQIPECDKQNNDVPLLKEPLEDIDLDDIHSVCALEEYGLERLKFALEARGLKCGGTLTERAERLLSVKGMKAAEYPQHIIAKKKKKSVN